ncbi:MAG: hypothetical protein ABRQ37_14765 [Candidatus Eremiobacterota bacterium]
MFFRIFIILFFILLFPVNILGFNEHMENNIEERMRLTGLNYEAKISKIKADILCLEDKKDEKITSSGEKKSTEDLEKRIKELETKLDETTKDYEAKLNDLKSSLEELKKEQQSLTDKVEINQALQQVTPAPEEVSSPPVQQAQQNINPDISVIGDFVISNDNPPNDNKAYLRETEIGFQAVVDPYARADFFVCAGDEGFEVENGYLTLLTLPGGLQSKVGKFRAGFGKVNQIHRHHYYMATYPNVIRNFMGDEGFSAPGVNFSVILPTDTYIEFTGEAFAGGNNLVFADHDNLVYLGHARTFLDLNESNTIEIGGTYAAGKYDVENSLNSQLAGVDFTYRWDPTDNDEHAFIFQSEALFDRQDLIGGTSTNSLGYYALAQYKLARRWDVGLRYDYSEFPGDSANNEKAYSLALSFHPSEFSRFRLQFTHTDTTLGESRDDYYLQTTFMIGPHGAHQF